MIKQILLAGAALMSVTSAYSGNSVALCGVDFSVDTLFHAKVGPGTTQTSLHLINKNTPNQQLRVFYLTVDLNTPNVKIETIVGNDQLAGGQTVSSMAKSHSTAEKTYFGGINTDFFYTSGTATNGKSIVGTPTRGAIVGGEIYRTADASNAFPNFFIDDAGVPHIAPLSFAEGTASAGSETVNFSVINNSAASEGLSVYTPRYYGILNQPKLNGSCAEIPAKIIEGDCIGAGKTVKMQVTGTATTTGDRVIADGEYMLVGRGNAMAFVQNLKEGDIVTLDAKTTVEGKPVVATELCAGNPWILRDGKTLESEGDRGDASARHPRSGIGFNNAKDKLVMMVIDGRSTISMGVHTMELADMMHYAGADHAMNIDGGGSSTLYAGAIGVRNKTSDGHERAVASGMFVTSASKEDNNIAEIRFVDWAMKFPKYGVYTPVFYGYNQYGMLIDTDVKGVTLSCDPAIGEIINDGTTFYGKGDGSGALKASFNGLEASIPVVVAANDQVSFRLSDVVIDNVREYPVEVQALVNEKQMPMNPSALNWASANPEIATVGADNGVLCGVANGKTTVSGTVGAFSGSLNVTVEIPESPVMPIVKDIVADEWTLKQTGGKGIAISGLDNGFSLNYTGNGAARGAYISADRTCQIWSLPTKLQVRINPGEAIVKRVSANISNALGEKVTSWTITDSELPKNEESVLAVNLSDNFNLEDIGIFPITVNSLRLDMGKSDKDKNYQIAVPGFEAVYEAGGAVETIETDALRIYPNPVVAGQPFSVEAEGNAVVQVFSLSGAKLMETPVCGRSLIPTADMAPGIYIIKASAENNSKTSKLIVR